MDKMECDDNNASGLKLANDEKVYKYMVEGDLDNSDQDNYDFSLLPETVWVEVLSYLCLHDQYQLSMTCQILYDMFNHPSNWKNAHIYLMGCGHNFGMHSTFMPDKFKHIVNKFGHYFQVC